jgi:hypothetical protein
MAPKMVDTLDLRNAVLQVRKAVEYSLEVAARRAFRKSLEDMEDAFVRSIPKPTVRAMAQPDGGYTIEVSFASQADRST